MKKTKKDKRLNKTPICLNCHTVINDQNFCSNCGQQNVDKQASLRDFIHDVLGDFFTFDHKFFRSFKPLLFKPGYLTKEYNDGRRVNYILPLRLYIFVSLVFFFVFTLKGFTDETVLEDDLSQHASIIEILFKKDKADSLQIYKLNDRILSRYNSIKTNKNGMIWNSILTNHFELEDSTRNKAAYYFQSTIQLEASKDFEATNEDSMSFFEELEESKLNFKEEEKHRLYNYLIQNYKIDFSGSSVDVNKSRYLRPELLKVFKDTISANYIYRELIIHNDYANITKDMNFGLNEMDSLENSISYSFLKKLEDQAAKLQAKGNAENLFWKEFIDQLPKVIFFLLPIFALIVKLVYIRRKIYYVNHLIFSLHVHSIIFIYLLVIILIEAEYLLFLFIPLLWFHLFFSIRYVYNQSKLMSFIKLNTIFFIYFFFLILGFAVTSTISLLQL